MSKFIEQLKSVESKNEELSTVVKDIAERNGNLEETIKKLEDKIQESETQRKSLMASTTTQPIDVKALKKSAADLYLKSVLLGTTPDNLPEYKKVVELAEKSIVPTDVTAWLAEEFSNDLIERLEVERQVENLFSRFQMPANRNTFSIPAKTQDIVAYLIAPDQAAIASAISGDKVSFATQRLKALVAITDQADQESVTALVAIARQSLIESIMRAMEEAIINGDTTTTDANNVRKTFNGLRKLALDAGVFVDGGGDAIAAADIVNARKLLGAYGQNINDLAIIAPLSVAYDMLKLPEALTIDKYGSRATFVTGEIGKVYGIPVIPSAYVPENLTAAGVEDTVTPGTLTEVLVVNTAYFAVADRGNITVEQDRNISTSANIYVAHRDVDFKPLTVPGDNPAVVPVYNITK